MFKNNIIRKRVLAVVEAKINAAQEQHDSEIEKLEYELETELDRVHTNHQNAREEVVERLVSQIIGKLL